jgi:hypothetical protein
MIFPTDSVIKLRERLEERASAGELSEADAYREALAADAEDPRALRVLALLAEEEGDFAGAEHLAWRWLAADPLSHEVFRLIGRLLARQPDQMQRAAAYTALGNEKLHYDPDAEPHPAAAEPVEESPEVIREMEPHRLLHALWAAGPDEVGRELIDRVLARGEDILPFLTGVLNLYGEGLLEDVDDALVARSMPLLGEIGSPKALPALARFLPLEDESLSGIGRWAFQRIAFRHTAEALEFIRSQIPEASPIELAAYAQQICLMPETPGRQDAVLSMGRHLDRFDREHRSVILVAMLVSAYVMEGLESALATTIERQHGAEITASARRELKTVRKEMENEPRYVAEQDEVSIYDLCCTAFEPLDEDEPVRAEPKPGRNDECWCGSGKKYKKCHLEADQSR